MSERFIVAVMPLVPHLVFLEVAVLIVLRVIWWLPDWCLKMVVLVTVAQRLRRSVSVNDTDD
jgi:hypothetical protein